jgi:hypothetical protein
MMPLESDLVKGVTMSKPEIKDLFSPVLFDIFNVNQPLLRYTMIPTNLLYQPD